MSNLALPTVHYCLSNEEKLGQEITLLAGQINAATHRLLKLIAEFDQRKEWVGGGTVRSCAHWLNWKCGIALGVAREKVRLALCLQQPPLIDASFASGEISYSKVRAMSCVATPENEDSQKSVSAETWADALSYAAPAVDGNTCIPRWHDEDCDYGMAIAALLRRDEPRCAG